MPNSIPEAVAYLIKNAQAQREKFEQRFMYEDAIFSKLPTFVEAQAYLLDCWVEQQRRYMSVVWFRPFTRDEEFNYLEFGEFPNAK